MKIYRISKPIPFEEQIWVEKNKNPTKFYSGGIQKIDKSTTQTVKDKFEAMFPKAKPLGGGMYGIAYDIGNGKVAKITTDNSELINAQKFKTHPSEHVVKVYDVIKIEEKTIIIIEKLKKLTKKESEIYEFVYNKMYSIVNFEDFHDEINDSLKTEEIADIFIEKLKSRYNYIDEKIDLIKKSSIFLIELGKMDLMDDAHVENIGKRGDDFVLLDLGNN